MQTEGYAFILRWMQLVIKPKVHFIQFPNFIKPGGRLNL